MIDELLLALDVYVHAPEARQSKSHPEVSALSEALRSLPLPLGRPDPERFRNVNGTFLKLQNFKAIDPEYTADGRVGMRRGVSDREQQIWDRYANRHDELRALAQHIRDGLTVRNLPAQPEEDEGGILEGRIVWRLHRDRERSASKVAQKKAKMRAELGELRCEICDFSEAQAAQRYGALTGDVFECHHTKPLHTLTGTTRTRVADLAVVCPTCHRSLHRVAPPITVAAMRSRVTSNVGL
jgi:5-methylcytosine-specific restriction protein A